VTHTLADVVRAPINLEGLPLRELMERCLDRNIKTRLAHIAEARIALERYAPTSEPRPQTSARPWLAWAVAGAASLAAAIGWYTATRPAPPRPLMHLNVEIPPATPLARVEVNRGIGGNMFALSPDGSRLVVSLRGADGKTRLHTRLLHQSQVTPLAGTENAHAPFFSPAGDWIGFFADGKLKKIAVEGGAAVTLCDARRGVGGSWGDDGNIVAALDTEAILSRIPAGGGTPVPVTKLDAGEGTHRWPQVLPGSRAVLFTAAARVGAGYDDANIEVVSLQTGERKTLHKGGFFPRYLAGAAGSTGNGHLVYLHQSTLFAVPFDAGRLTLAGAPVPILEDISSTQVAGGDFTFAGNGTFVYLAGKESLDSFPISWVDSTGKTTQPLHATPGDYRTLRFSPDGKRLAFAIDTGKGSDIWVKDLDRDTTSRLSFLPGPNAFPVWTPDGRTIVFQSTNEASPGLYAIRSDGSGEAKRLTERAQLPFSFSPDGKHLATTQMTKTRGNIFTLPVEVDASPGAAGIRLGKA